MQIKFWERIYLSPDFEVIVCISIIVLLFLVISISNLYINWKKTRHFIKMTEPFKKLSKKDTKELLMSIFTKARTEADEELLDTETSGNQDLMINILSNAMVALDRQGEGLAELMQVASIARGVIKAGKSLDEIVIDAKNRIYSLKGDFDENSKASLIAALDNNPKEFFKKILINSDNSEQVTSLSESDEKDVDANDPTQVENLESTKLTASEVRELIKDDSKYLGLKRRLNGGEWSVLGNWVFEGEGKIIPATQFMVIYAIFKEKVSNHNSTDEEKKIYEYLDSQKRGRHISGILKN